MHQKIKHITIAYQQRDEPAQTSKMGCLFLAPATFVICFN